jgi:hypothetical protein
VDVEQNKNKCQIMFSYTVLTFDDLMVNYPIWRIPGAVASLKLYLLLPFKYYEPSIFTFSLRSETIKLTGTK